MQSIEHTQYNGQRAVTGRDFSLGMSPSWRSPEHSIG
jgi:hypothetical protein